MRIIKTNTYKYDPYFLTLPLVKKAAIGSSYLRFVKNGSAEAYEQEKSEHLDMLFNYQEELNNYNDLNNILLSYFSAVKKLLSYKEIGIFFFTDNRLSLEPINENVSDKSKKFINSIYSEGVLEWLFETGKSKVIPDFTNNNPNHKQNYFLIPFLEGKKSKGVLSLFLGESKINENSLSIQILKTITGMTLPKLEVIKKKEELVSVYHELQVYQSKLSNDFKLSAVGELTVGVSEEVLSSLQIMLSHLDFLTQDENSDQEIINSIVQQVNKIKIFINRLVKFSDVNSNQNKSYPCDLNAEITDYYNVITPTLKSGNYECMLDLEKDLPPILSQPTYINQILVNVFSLLKPQSTDGGGIIVQTKNNRENVVLRLFTTDFIEILIDKQSLNKNMSYKILDKIVKKHEGTMQIVSKNDSGTNIVINFPLRRKLR